MIEKEIFEKRKTAFLMERKDLDEKLALLKEDGRQVPDRLAEFLELAGNAYSSYKLKLTEEKRDFLKIATSNRRVEGKNVDINLKIPFDDVANRFENPNGSPQRDIPRTWDRLIARLWKFFETSPNADTGGRLSPMLPS